MNKIFIVNGSEFRVGNTYSKTDSRKFKAVDDLSDAIWQITAKKHTIVIAKEIVTEDNKTVFKLEEELDYKKILNSNELAPLRKLRYLEEAKKVLQYNNYKIILDEAMDFLNSCDDLEFSLCVITGFLKNKEGLYSKHLENILNNDSTGKYLSQIRYLEDSSKQYAENIVAKLFDTAEKNKNLTYIMNFMVNLSGCKYSNLKPRIDLYKVLELVDKYDFTGEYYAKLFEVEPYFELKHVQSRIIELAKETKNCTYCVSMLNVINFGSNFSYLKTARINELVEVIINYWDDKIGTYFITRGVIENISKENLSKLMDKYDDKDKAIINVYM